MAVVKCPSCGASVQWSVTSLYRPFCSARCKNVDFGAWASERYAIEDGESGPDREAPQDDA